MSNYSTDTFTPNNCSNEVPASCSITTPSHQASNVCKTEKVEPIFRIVEAYDKRNIRAVDKNVKVNTSIMPEEESRQRGDLYADEKGPVWHKTTNPMITRPIIAKNLPLQFNDLPIFGAPDCSANLEEYENRKIREFVGFDLDDAEFNELKNYCNPANLKTGKELKMDTNYPVMGLLSKHFVKADDTDEEISEEEHSTEADLCILKRVRKRKKLDSKSTATKLLKYRGIKQLPLREQEDSIPGMNLEPPDLEPGKDVLYRIRVFRPFTFQLTGTGEKHVRGRHSVFHCDIVLPGRQVLTALRDRFSCRNDLDMRLDKSHNPEEQTISSAKVVFPSGFLFINNVFYVDGRAGCRDTSAGVRRWAAARGLGAFPVRAMERTRLDDALVRLAHPEVYVHQGSCEHVFLISEVRLLNRSDPLHLAAYPCHTLMSQNQSIYCTTCAEFGAKWLVTGSNRVPFDPAFFCEVCFKQYLYKDGQKIGDFKAFAYRGNELIIKNPGN